MNSKLQFASFGRSFDTQQQGYPMEHIGPCRGVPLNPVKSSPPQKRDKMVKVRLTEDELKTLKAPLMENGQSKRGLSEEIRARLFRRKSKTSHGGDCEHCRLLANVANGLNILARQCEKLPDQTQAIEVIVSLRSLEREILKAAK